MRNLFFPASTTERIRFAARLWTASPIPPAFNMNQYTTGGINSHETTLPVPSWWSMLVLLRKHEHPNPLEFCFKILGLFYFILLQILLSHRIRHLQLQQTQTRRMAVSPALGSDTMSTHTSLTLTFLHGQQTWDWQAQPLSCTHFHYILAPPHHRPLPNPPDTRAHAHPSLFTPECDIICHDNPLTTPTTSCPLPWPDEYASHIPIWSNLPTPRTPNPGRMNEPAAPPFRQSPLTISYPPPWPDKPASHPSHPPMNAQPSNVTLTSQFHHFNSHHLAILSPFTTVCSHYNPLSNWYPATDYKPIPDPTPRTSAPFNTPSPIRNLAHSSTASNGRMVLNSWWIGHLDTHRMLNEC